MIEIKGDAVLIKQEGLGDNEYGAIFKGEMISTQSKYVKPMTITFYLLSQLNLHVLELLTITHYFLSSVNGDENEVVLINEIDLCSQNPMDVMQQFVQKLVASPTLYQSRNSPHIVKCFGPYLNSNVSNYE